MRRPHCLGSKDADMVSRDEVGVADGGEAGKGVCYAGDYRGGEVEGFGGWGGFVEGVVEGDWGAFAVDAVEEAGDGEV